MEELKKKFAQLKACRLDEYCGSNLYIKVPACLSAARCTEYSESAPLSCARVLHC